MGKKKNKKTSTIMHRGDLSPIMGCVACSFHLGDFLRGKLNNYTFYILSCPNLYLYLYVKDTDVRTQSLVKIKYFKCICCKCDFEIVCASPATHLTGHHCPRQTNRYVNTYREN